MLRKVVYKHVKSEVLAVAKTGMSIWKFGETKRSLQQYRTAYHAGTLAREKEDVWRLASNVLGVQPTFNGWRSDLCCITEMALASAIAS